MSRLLGFSTGTLYQTNLSLIERADVFRKLGCGAIELGFSGANSLENLNIEDLNEITAGFDWCSVHAPAAIFYDRDPETKAILDFIEAVHQQHKLDLVVFHPDRFKNFEILNEYTFPIAMENMDSRKESYQNTEDLQRLFTANPAWSMVLDLNHCYTIDPSMQGAIELREAFNGRIKEVQISGYKELHDPLYENDQAIILESAPENDCIFIVESLLSGPEAAKKEFDYINSVLKL